MTKSDVVPNELFWDARMRAGLSRPAVADLANQQSVMATCEHEPLTENYIGRIEQGRIGGGMCPERRSALCRTLGVDDPASIGLISERRRPTRSAACRPRAGEPGAVPDGEQVREAFRVLGVRLAAARKAEELTQQKLAAKIPYSRSTVANVEMGRHEIARAFWEHVDPVVRARGVLLAAYDEASALSRQVRALEELRRGGADSPQDAAGLPERGASSAGHPATSGPVAAVAGAVTLTVTPTAAGGVRIVIETGPPDDPGADVGSDGEGARVLPLVAPARRGARRGRRLA
ncbi:helix-turn-helix domain-containing protein [Paractinoplanes deccanensis]|uniref:helix-turn-helix domain-containing protein n=1 Tax=Paractinoplanes deccanensis TaxID=113561 RepID=UPI0019440C95|nr:helix-turn-helix domain-containing protein [Actinoplanes deccanensis]